MARYTVVLLDYLRSLTDVGLQYVSPSEIISKARQNIFNFDYPIHDESYREQLETKILRHYAMYEIGQETPYLFQFLLENKMMEIMPLYAKRLETATLQFNPLYTVDMKRTTTTTGKSENENTAESNTKVQNNGKNTDKFSDTPQSMLQDIENATYLTNVSINNSENLDINESVNTGKGKVTTLNEYVEQVQGKGDGQSFSSLLNEYRETLQNYDMDIINELSVLFMGVW